MMLSLRLVFLRVSFWAQFYSVYMSVRLSILDTNTKSQFICMQMIFSVTLVFLMIHQNLLSFIIFIQCSISDLKSWMNANFLMLNELKTNFVEFVPFLNAALK